MHTQTAKNEKVKVSIRLRPFSEEEKRIDSTTPIESIDETQNTMNIKRNFENKQYTFDKIFPSTSTQEDIFISVKDIINVSISKIKIVCIKWI